ncbi:MAG: hypothetical protein O3B75_03400, partial [Planctomycetota bacterium]|nr:hypothetical protein [Planctomycetota bacterium]
MIHNTLLHFIGCFLTLSFCTSVALAQQSRVAKPSGTNARVPPTNAAKAKTSAVTTSKVVVDKKSAKTAPATTATKPAKTAPATKATKPAKTAP